LIHGFPLDRTMWRAQVTHLRGFARIAPDLRGFGLSDPPPENWTLADHADDLASILDELKVGQAVVCGLSMGGYIAFELWRRHRSRVRGLVLADTRAEAETQEGKGRRAEMLDLVRRSGPGAVADVMLPMLLGPATLKTDPQVAAHIRTMIADSSPGGLAAAVRAMRDRSASNGILSTIDVPTLVVAGAEDGMIPVDAQRALAEAIPGARFESIPLAGHLAPLEQPQVFNRVVAAFLDGMK
jgi:3-oxoadipate enol-lactonase